MPIYLEIKTDLRVKDILPIMMEIESLEFVQEIDSLNYGEGYDLKYQDIEIRLYDDERSDQVQMDEGYRDGSLSWDQAFEKYILENPKQGILKVQIDRYNNFNMDGQTEISQKIVELLIKDNYTVISEIR